MIYEEQSAEQISELKKPRNAGFSFTLTVLSMLVVSFLFSLVIVFNYGESEEYLKEDWYKLLSYFFTSVAFVVAIPIVLKLSNFSVKNTIGRVKIEPIWFLIALGVLAAMLLGLRDVNNWTLSALESLGYKPKGTDDVLPSLNVANVAFSIIVIGIIPPIVEEFVFRGVILNNLKPLGTKKAVIFSAVMFSVYHMSPEKTVYQLIVGIIFAMLALACDSILPTIIIHIFNNVIIVINEFFFKNMKLGDIIDIIIYIVGFAALAVSVYYIFKKLQKNEQTVSGSDFYFSAFPGVFVALFLWVSKFFG